MTEGDPSRRRLRLHRRRAPARPAACSPIGCRPIRRTACWCSRRAARQLDLVPHSGRLSLRHRQSARRLDVPDREGAGPERPRAQLSARQGDRRLLGHQRHDLDARPGGGLRSLAAARPHRLGLGRRAAGLPQARRPFPGRHRASRRRRRVAGRAAARALGRARCGDQGRRRDGHPADRRLQHRRQ